MHEPDRANLAVRLHEAEWAIFQRWQELGGHAWGTDEGIAIAAAVEDLLSIKIHELKWPDFRTNFITPHQA